MKVYTENPAKIIIKSRQNVYLMENKVLDYVRKNSLPAEFKTDEIVISTFTDKQKLTLWDRLKELGIKYTEKR